MTHTPPSDPILSYRELCDALAAADIRVHAVGEALRVTHAARLTPPLRTALRVHKARLLAECNLPLWAQVYAVFGGDVYEGHRKLSVKQVAREMAALTQPDLDISSSGMLHPCAARQCRNNPGSPESVLMPGGMERTAEGGQPLTLTPPPYEGGGWEGVHTLHV